MSIPTEMEPQYMPPWWLKNRHFQTCLMALFPTKTKEPLIWEQLHLPDGDFIDVCWAGPDSGPIAVMLHGLEGSVTSHYIQTMISELVSMGYRVAVMHFRSCSGRLNRLPESYHACQTQDLAFLLSQIKSRSPDRPVIGIGFSLGANVLLRYLCDAQEYALVDKAIALSVPFELNACAKALGSFYQWQFLRTMKRKVKEKIRLKYKLPFNEKDLGLIKNMIDFDSAVTAPLHGFKNVKAYYERATVRTHLKRIKKPLLVLHAFDDPLVPRDAIPAFDELASDTELLLTENGGHLGFLQARSPFELDYWWRCKMLDFLQNKSS